MCCCSSTKMYFNALLPKSLSLFFVWIQCLQILAKLYSSHIDSRMYDICSGDPEFQTSHKPSHNLFAHTHPQFIFVL